MTTRTILGNQRVRSVIWETANFYLLNTPQKEKCSFGLNIKAFLADLHATKHFYFLH